MPNDLVVLTEPLPDAPAAWLADRARVRISHSRDPEFADCIRSARGLVIRTDTMVDEPLLAGAPELRVVGRAGVGVDNVDLAACARRGVQVVYTPGANTQAVVEFVLAELAERFRPRCRVAAPLSRAAWQALRAGSIAPRQLDELTIGILGLGRIGSRLAAVAAALGAEVLYHDLLDLPAEARGGACPVGPGDLFSRADVLSVHVDGRAANRGLVGADLIDRMKPDVTIVNTSRGFVVDSLALADFLRDHPPACAILDVHEAEPFGADYPLLGLENAWLSPHQAGRTEAALERMGWVVRDVVAVLRGEAPRWKAE